MKTICGILLGLSLVVGTAAFGQEKKDDTRPKPEQSKAAEKAKAQTKAKPETDAKSATKNKANQKNTRGKAGEPKAQ